MTEHFEPKLSPLPQIPETMPEADSLDPQFGPAHNPLLYACRGHELHCETQFSPDAELPSEIVTHPHEIETRLAVQVALSLRDSGTYQQNVDISSLAEYLHNMTTQFSVRGNTVIEQTLSLQSLALSGMFGGLLQETSSDESQEMKAERVRSALQAQKQYCKTLYLLHGLQEQARKFIEAPRAY